MAISYTKPTVSYTKPTFNETPPEPPINLAEATRIRTARDAQHNLVATAAESINTALATVATAVESLVTVSNTDTLKLTTAAGKIAADTLGADAGAGVKAWALVTSSGTNVNITATGKFTTDATVPADQSTLAIGSKTYKFVSAAPAAEGEVLIEATVADTLTNLSNAILADATTKTAGKHFCVVVHPQVTCSCSATVATLTSILKGTVGNGYTLTASTDPASHFTATAMGGAGMTAGVDHTITINAKVYTFVGDTPNAEGEVLVGSSVADSLDNLKLAVNGDSATLGVKHYCTAHTTVEATTNTDTTQLFEQRIPSYAGNSYAISTTATPYTLYYPYFRDGTPVLGTQMFDFLSEKARFTPGGGFAVKLVNKTGAASIKGTVVAANPTVARSFILSAVGTIDPIGVVYEGGVADASECWVVVSGLAQVLFTNNVTTTNKFVRVGVSADSGEAAGYAVAAAIPANPNVAADEHFMEIGHALEESTAGALTWCMIHFN